MNKEIIENLKEELKGAQKWVELKAINKLEKQLKEAQRKLQKIEDKKQEIENYRRVTIFTRKCLHRGLKNYYQEIEETKVLYNASDKKIAKYLEELNEKKKSRFFEIKYDFKTNTIKGLKEYKKYLVDKEVL